jgi:hypothetical protein
MNFFEMANKRVPSTKAQNQRNILANKLTQLQEDAVLNNQIQAEEHFDSRRSAISEMANQFGTSRQSSRRKILAERTQYKNSLRDKLFLESIYTMFMEGLVLDDNFKEQYAGNFYELTEQMVNNLFESGQLSYKQIQNEGSQIMQTVLQLCEETAEKAVKEKFDIADANSKKSAKKALKHESGCTCSECGGPSTDGGKNEKKVVLSEKIKGDFDEKKNMETKAVAGVVKDKVVQVIRDEQDAAEKEQDVNDEIEEKTASQDDTGVEASEGANVEDTNEEDNATVSESVRVVRKKNQLPQYSLFKSLQVSIANKNLQEMQAMSESEDVELNMDMVLAEAVAYYTLMETLYTARLITPTASEMRSFAKELTLTKKK